MSSVADDGLRIISRAGGDVPFGYTVSETGTLTVTSAHATFDGSGASGAYLPCLSFYQQNGVLLGRFFPDSGAVAAGSDADVSYGPFLGGASASNVAAATSEWAAAWLDSNDPSSPYSAPLGASSPGFAHFATSNTSVFSTSPSGMSGDVLIVGAPAGVYHQFLAVQWQAGNFNRFACIQNFTFASNMSQITHPADAYNTPPAVSPLPLTMDTAFGVFPLAGTAAFGIHLFNGAAINVNVIRFELHVLYVPVTGGVIQPY